MLNGQTFFNYQNKYRNAEIEQMDEETHPLHNRKFPYSLMEENFKDMNKFINSKFFMEFAHGNVLTV